MIEMCDLKCSLCNNIIKEDKEEWDIIDGLEFCECCKNKLEAVEKIESAFMHIICDTIGDIKSKNNYHIYKTT